MTASASTDEVPRPSPAASDLACWLHAAYPLTPRGRLDLERAAEAFGVSSSTLRRWISTGQDKLPPGKWARLHQRAILRGKGTYLWPDLDETTRQRFALRAQYAEDSLRGLLDDTQQSPKAWRDNGTLAPHAVALVHWEHAHCYGVTSWQHEKSQARVSRRGAVVEVKIVPNRFEATLLKRDVLSRVEEYRCVAPRSLVPTGRTETWREEGGPSPLREPEPVTLIRFPGLVAGQRLAAALRGMWVDVDERVVSSAAEVAQALSATTRPVVLTGPGFTATSWRASRTANPWPGGSWWIGSQAAGGPGMSLLELAAELEQGQISAPRVVIHSSPVPSRLASRIRRALAPTGVELLRSRRSFVDTEASEVLTALADPLT